MKSGGHSGVRHVEQSVRTKAEVIWKQKPVRAFALHAPDLVSTFADADQRPEASFRDPDPAVAIGRQSIRTATRRSDHAVIAARIEPRDAKGPAAAIPHRVAIAMRFTVTSRSWAVTSIRAACGHARPSASAGPRCHDSLSLLRPLRRTGRRRERSSQVGHRGKAA